MSVEPSTGVATTESSPRQLLCDTNDLAATVADCSLEPRPTGVAAKGMVRVPWWVPLWERRSFDFSACLDPFVAAAAVNITVWAHLHKHASRSSLPAALRIFDPCCGSGTVLAAAAALGHTALGTDVRAEFVSRVPGNLEGLGLEAAYLGVQDAAAEFPAQLLSEENVPHVVVCNPPWGKNFGADDDGTRIILSVIRQFAGATMLFLVNAEAFEAARKLPGVSVLHHARLGGVEAILLSTEKA